MIGELNKTEEWIRNALKESKGEPKEYIIFSPDPDEVMKRVKENKK